MDLKGKIAIITGGGSGIGRATALAMAENGAEIFVCGRRLDKLDETKSLIEERGGKCTAYALDISNDVEIENFFAAFKKTKFNILINNAGILGPCPEDFLSTTRKQLCEVLDVNLLATVKMSQEFIKNAFQHNIGGSIVHISSICASQKNSNYISYATSKSALLGLSSGLASRYGYYGIRSNTILAGFIETDMTYQENPNFQSAREELARQHPVGRVGTPRDVASAAVYLASDNAGFVTGTTLLIDGGLSVSD